MCVAISVLPTFFNQKSKELSPKHSRQFRSIFGKALPASDMPGHCPHQICHVALTCFDYVWGFMLVVSTKICTKGRRFELGIVWETLDRIASASLPECSAHSQAHRRLMQTCYACSGTCRPFCWSLWHPLRLGWQKSWLRALLHFAQASRNVVRNP